MQKILVVRKCKHELYVSQGCRFEELELRILLAAALLEAKRLSRNASKICKVTGAICPQSTRAANTSIAMRFYTLHASARVCCEQPGFGPGLNN